MERVELQDRLRELVLAPPADPEQPGVVGIHGAGGFGKSTLVEQVSRLPEVRERFPGGVLWAAVGQRRTGASLAELIGDLMTRVGAERPAVVSPMQAGRRLATVLDQHPPLLLVLDDVWTTDQLDPFLTGGPASLRVVTTRVAGLLGPDAPQVAVGRMTHDEATATLLHGLLGLPLPDLTALLSLTGRWPLLLTLTNALLREHTTARHPSPPPTTAPGLGVSGATTPRPGASSTTLRPGVSGPTPCPGVSGATNTPGTATSPTPTSPTSLTASDPAPPQVSGASRGGSSGGVRAPMDLRGAAQRLVDQLGADGTVALDPAVPGERERALDRVVQAALDLLSEPDQRRLLELAILPEGAAIPDQTLDLLWSGTGGLSPAASSEVRTTLARLRLVHHAGGATSVGHVLRAYVRDRLPDTELPQVHRRLVEMARPRSGGPWWTLPQTDRYLWRHLAFHLREARWWDELFVVTTDLQRLAIGIPMLGIAAMVADLDRLPDPRATALRARLTRAAPLLRPIRPAAAFADVLLSQLAGSPELAAEVTKFAAEQRPRAALRPRWPLPDVGPDSLTRVITPGTGWLDCAAAAPTTAPSSASTSAPADAPSSASTSAPSAAAASAPVAHQAAPGGSSLAAGGTNGVITLVEATSGTLLGRLTAHAGGVKALAAAGTRLVSGGADGTLRLWDVRRQLLEQTLWTTSGEIPALAVTPSADRIAAVSSRGELAVFDQNARSFTWFSADPLVSCAFLTPDRLLTVEATGTLTEHHLRTGRSHPLPLPSPVASGPAPSPTPGSVAPRPAPSGTTIDSSQERALITAMAVDPVGQWVALSRTDGEIHVHSLPAESVPVASGGDSPPVVLRGHRGRVSALCVSGDRIISGGEDGTVRVWDRYGPQVALVRAHAGWVTSGVLAADRRTLITTGSDATIRVWDLPRLVQETVAGPIDWVNTCALTRAGTELTTGSRDGVVRLWRSTDATATAIWSTGEPVLQCIPAPDNRWLLARCPSRTVLLHRPTPKPEAPWRVEEWSTAAGSAVSPDEDLVAQWDEHGAVEIRSVTGTAFFRRTHSRPVQAAAFLPRHRLVFADDSGTLTTWQFRTDRTRSGPAWPFPTTAGPRVRAIQSVADRIVVIDAVSVALFDPRTIRLIAAAPLPDDPVTHGAVSPDGRWLATTSESGELRVWPLRELTGDPEPIAAMRVDGALFECAWTPDSLDLYAAGQRGVYAFTFRPPRATSRPSAPTRTPAPGPT
ncbi:WD40 repeat protein [Actinoplanes octamycinicus]|uniref:WD40 repeat protein n=1 Tax=Actinoplanes octamycinicus TaxID=135948 RepID=A0A7W7M850_9ACTN|nr:NB-ARC domain-containing protein [Actinoplanes octamycinicus]MBB4740490.1 WD40 repeat protein [Actinoplanes octamycinicus]